MVVGVLVTVATATETCEAAWLINTVCVPIVLAGCARANEQIELYGMTYGTYTHTDTGSVLIVSVGLAQARPN